MDPEQTFLRVHARVSGMLSQLLTPRIRTVLEYVYLVVAVVLFSVLVVMHTNFVQQPGCSSQLSGVEITEAQLVRIKITSAGLWSPVAYDGVMLDEKQEILPANFKVPNDNDDNFAFTAANLLSTWINTGSKRSKLNFKSWRGEKEILEHQIEMAVGSSMTSAVPDEMENKDDRGAPKIGTQQIGFMSRESLKMTVVHIFRKWSSRFSSFWGSLNQFFASASKLWNIAGLEMIANIPRFLRALQLDHVTAFTVQLLEKSSRAHDPTFLYTTEKGYFLLPEDAKSQHHIRTVNVSISADNTCFGNRWQRILINKFIGYDTILTNSLLSSPGPGYLYNFQTKEFYDLSHGPESADATAQFGDYFVTKCSVLLMSLFVFFTTTMSVSFTLRETQSRMLKFTVQLQHHARHHLPTFQLIFVHVIESLVFVPIMIGILFFLFEFYDDQLLAFLVLTLVWLCELFTMISVRTPLSMQFFPRFFLLYFLVFHIYFFSYAHGFSYLAFSTTAAFMQHLILFFWNRYEVPALQRFMRNRAQLQQQTGVHITSSTILTSTLHIARVNMRNPNITHNELGVIPEPRLEHEQVQSVDNSGPQPPTVGIPDSTGLALHIARVNMRNPNLTHNELGVIPEPRLEHEQVQSVDNSGPQPSTVSIPDSTGLAESNAQQTETAPASNSLNPFGSFLLSILGGASTDGVVSLFSLFRDLRDQHNVSVEPTPDGNEAAT